MNAPLRRGAVCGELQQAVIARPPLARQQEPLGGFALPGALMFEERNQLFGGSLGEIGTAANCQSLTPALSHGERENAPNAAAVVAKALVGAALELVGD